MDYEMILNSYSSLIEKDLKEQFRQLIEDAKKYHPYIANVYDAIEEFVLRGGRRLGSCSTLMVYKGYTNKIDDKIVKASSGIELCRHSILVHDDIVDAEMFRRGGKTLHKILGENFDEHFGEGSAIFVGNMLYSIAISTLLESDFCSDKLKSVVKLISEDFQDVNESQILDLLFEYKEPRIKEWEIMASKRAASLFRTSMLAGAILASAPPKDISLLEDASMHIGYAFDIQDDIIDTFASKEQYGREPCEDIVKQKKPLHIIIALKRDKHLASVIESGDKLTGPLIDDIQELIRNCGALDNAKSISRAHAKEAERLISMTNMNTEAKEFFASFIKYIDESLDWYK